MFLIAALYGTTECFESILNRHKYFQFTTNKPVFDRTELSL
jgi:hypothetical protein